MTYRNLKKKKLQKYKLWLLFTIFFFFFLLSCIIFLKVNNNHKHIFFTFLYYFIFIWYFFFFFVELVDYHWSVRKTYQTSLYKFNTYHEYNLINIEYTFFNIVLEFKRLYTYTYLYFFKFLKLFTPIMYDKITINWYGSCWFGWICLTVYLYYNAQVHDLGPSYEILDYNPDIRMGLYRTIGPFLLISWTLWTLVANSVFISSIFFF